MMINDPRRGRLTRKRCQELLVAGSGLMARLTALASICTHTDRGGGH
jgi:hypothetical protein